MGTCRDAELAGPGGRRGRGYGPGDEKDLGLRVRVSGPWSREWPRRGGSLRPVRGHDQDREIRVLRDRIRAMEARLRFLDDRIRAAGPEIKSSDVRASVDMDRCVGCGSCEGVCPVGAIFVDRVARVNLARCIGCGACAAQCPRGAMRMTPPMASTAP